MASILVIEDSPDSIELIQRALQANELHLAGSLEEARTLIEGTIPFDLILLDLTLPDGDGLILGSELSCGGRPRIPIIVLSGRTDVRDKIAAFSIGAEDYIEKPFDPLEFQARVAARLRRFESEADHKDEISLGTLRLELDTMRAFERGAKGDVEIDLSPTEHRILRVLIEKPGRLYTREALISQIWGDTIVGPRTVDAHVSNLRGKISRSGTQIEAVRGQGYRLELSSPSSKVDSGA